MRDQTSDAIRRCAVDLLSMTAMAGTLVAVSPSQQAGRDNPASAIVALGLSVGVAIVVLVSASRAIEHKDPDWRALFRRTKYDEPYEWLAVFAMLGLSVVVAALIAVLIASASSLVAMVGGLYAGNVVRSLIIAGGKSTQQS